jgi:uncharacterized protein YggE
MHVFPIVDGLSNVKGRDVTMERLLRVEGKGKKSSKPDMIQLNFNLVATHNEYRKALEISTESYVNLEESFIQAGIEKQEIKTSNLRIETLYESVSEGRIFRSVFKGYAMHTNVFVEIPLDFDLLSKIIDGISKKGITPEFTINFAVKDDQDAVLLALAEAVSDAKAKAEALAKASGVTLGMIKNMSYRAQEGVFSPTRMDFSLMEKKSSLNLDMTPRDVEISQNVEIWWEII